MDQRWLSVSALLLTEFDGRFADPNTIVPYPTTPTLRRHDDLPTSAGYNYLTYGQNHVITRNAETWVPFLPRNTALTVAWSGHLGVTKDSLILAQAQTALHDFRGVTHNFRPNLEEGHFLLGADVEVLVWPETKWLALGGHYTAGTFHHERGLTGILVDRFGTVRLHAAGTFGWLSDAGVGPWAIKNATDGHYWSARAGIAHTDRYGLNVGYSSGIFANEPEVLLSFFVGTQLSSTYWLRIEFMNDMLGSKDRGFTGGGRLGLVYTP